MIKDWCELPKNLQHDAIRPYYLFLYKYRYKLVVKRLFDICFSLLLIVLFSPILLCLFCIVGFSSRSFPVFTQVRITQYGRLFKIYKFRTMVAQQSINAPQVTLQDDPRITRVGRILRKTRLDELPQLFNILKGEMSFVGVRPEVPLFVEKYTDEMLATLLLPAGVTSICSLNFSNEAELLSQSDDWQAVYVEKLLPDKMRLNLDYLMRFSLKEDISIIFWTVLHSLGHSPKKAISERLLSSENFLQNIGKKSV